MRNWIHITEIDVLEADGGPIVKGAREAFLTEGQGDPLPGLISAVVQEVRGYVAGGNYKLNAGETIPAVLENQAVDLVIYRLVSRLPNIPQRNWKERADAAIARLKEVARGQFAIPEPEEPDSNFVEGQQRPGPSLAPANPNRHFGRQAADGL